VTKDEIICASLVIIIALSALLVLSSTFFLFLVRRAEKRQAERDKQISDSTKPQKNQIP
jgi:preprotein translocase subunit YajC